MKIGQYLAKIWAIISGFTFLLFGPPCILKSCIVYRISNSGSISDARRTAHAVPKDVSSHAEICRLFHIFRIKNI